MRGSIKAVVVVRVSRSFSTVPLNRREKDRSGWASIHKDEDYSVFPDEHLGDQYNVNWAVANYNITAAKSTFHNLHARGLVMFSTDASLDKNKAVVVETSHANDKNVLVVGSQISEKQFARVFRHIRETLSSGSEIFVHDGSLGLARGYGPTVRSFAQSGSSALLLHNSLRTFALPLEEVSDVSYEQWLHTLPEELRNDRRRVGDMVRLGQLESPRVRDSHDMTQFLVPSLEVNEDVQAVGANFTIVDPLRKIVVHAGSNVNPSAVRNALVQLAVLSKATTSTIVAADARLSKSGNAVVVFGAGPSTEPVFSAHHTIIGADGIVTPVWLSGSVSGGSATRFADYVEKDGKQLLTVGRRRGPKDPFSAKAEAVVFVDSSKKDVTRINPEQVRQYAQASGVANADAFVDHVTKSKLSAFAAPAAPAGDKWVEGVLSTKQ